MLVYFVVHRNKEHQVTFKYAGVFSFMQYLYHGFAS